MLGLASSAAFYVTSLVFKAWNGLIWVFSQLGRMIVFILNWTMFPQKKTRRPHPFAIVAWLVVNAGLFVRLGFYGNPDSQFIIGITAASLHFLIIVTVLLVISEENDVWSGYIRVDRVSSEGHKDFRTFKHGKIVKSLPLIVISAIFYLTFLAVAVKGLHATHNILSVAHYPSISIFHYVVVVFVQVPLVETALKWSKLSALMEFNGLAGTAIKLAIHVSNISIILGTLNSYFRQKSQLRRMVDGLGSEKGNIQLLQAQAARAPEEIKVSIINMALHDPAARVRYRAMAVAEHANTLTFPNTAVYHLHKEPVDRNKARALAVSINIIRNNAGQLERDFLEAVRTKADFQLGRKRRKHSQWILEKLQELRAIVDRALLSLRDRTGR
jgi:hypothetical protein